MQSDSVGERKKTDAPTPDDKHTENSTDVGAGGDAKQKNSTKKKAGKSALDEIDNEVRFIIIYGIHAKRKKKGILNSS